MGGQWVQIQNTVYDTSFQCAIAETETKNIRSGGQPGSKSLPALAERFLYPDARSSVTTVRFPALAALCSRFSVPCNLNNAAYF